MAQPASADYSGFWFDVRKLVSQTELAFDRRLRTELDISLTLYFVLSVIEVQPGAFNQRGVAELLGTTSATVSRQLFAGARAGHLSVAPSATSRRENEVTLTESGRGLVERGDIILREESERLLGRVPAADFAVASRVITAMLDAVPGGAVGTVTS